MISVLQHIGIIGEQTLLYLPLLFGSYLAISLMQIPNLSIEGALIIGAIAGSSVYTGTNSHTLSLIAGLVCAAVSAGTVGVGAGLLHAYAKLSHLLSSIVMMGGIYGISLLLMHGSHRSLNPTDNHLNMLSIFTQYPAFVTLVILGIIISILMCFFLKTKLGATCTVYGDNPRFLTNHRISTPYIICVGLGLANALAGISGYLIAQHNSFIDTGMGAGIPLLCITALMLGKIFSSAHKPIVFVLPILGTVSYFSMQTILLLIGFDLHYFPLVQAAVLTVIFFTQRSRHDFTIGI